ncbi:hypothetical protein F0562_024922 [Nyssa sinensis]|uniref:Pentacotripeptide-repeat region of PRORP domain-containing protein n=1 Tax=Nyssa sinensis TaxID=561372 RepID=A0A5J5BF84_9ASTE|nr:hypothetical protein F0562_024922 [Nyssa sinensis]
MERYLISLLHRPLHINQFKQVHALIIAKYLTLTPIFVKGLLSLSFVDYGRKVFDQIPQPDQTLYNSIISAYSRLSQNKKVIEGFFLMHSKDTGINCYTIPPVLKACTSLLAIDLGKQIHSLSINYGFHSNVFVQTGLIDFYAKIGDLESGKQIFDEILVKDPICYNCLISGLSRSGDVLTARKIFDEMTERTIVSWNSILNCYAHNGEYLEGFKIFERMQAEKFHPNEFTVVTVLSICAKLGNLEMGLRIKKFIDDNNLCFNMIVSTALLEMYVKCGAVDNARREFDRMPERDVVAWSAMIAGYAQNGRSNEALELFECMKSEKIKPNDVTLVSVLSACAQLGSVEAGEQIGSYVESHGLDSNVYLASALLELAELSVNKLLELEPENSGNYVLLSNIYASVGRWQEASKVRSFMIKKGLQKTAAYSWIELEDKVHKFLVGDTSHPRSEDVYSIVDGLAMHSNWATYDFDFDSEF